MTDAESKINNEINTNETKMNAELNNKIVEVVAPVEEKKKKVVKTKTADEKTAVAKPKTNLVIEKEEKVENKVEDKVEDKVVDEVAVAVVTFAEPLTDIMLYNNTDVSSSCNSNSNSNSNNVSSEDEMLDLLNIKSKDIAKQIHMIETSKKLKTSIKDMRRVLVSNRKDKSIKIRNEIAELRLIAKKVEDEMDALQELQDDELIDTIVGNADLETELGLIQSFKVAPKSSAFVAGSEVKAKQERVTYDRDAQFAALPVGLTLTIKYKDNIDGVFKKTKEGLIRKGVKYETLSQAGKAYYAEIGAVKKTFNAWSEFKVTNSAKKEVSLEKYVM